jgi:PBP1b-binding outer membrane lipoprotein LpoB
MRIISLIALSFILAGCAHKPVSNSDNAASCTEKFPTYQEFMTMAYPTLYQWSINALMAQDIVSNKNATGQPPKPCDSMLAYLGDTSIAQAMRYR